MIIIRLIVLRLHSATEKDLFVNLLRAIIKNKKHKEKVNLSQNMYCKIRAGPYLTLQVLTRVMIFETTLINPYLFIIPFVRDIFTGEGEQNNV